MGRRKRCYIPGIPYHLVQRGNNRQQCFHSPSDHEHYLSLLVRHSRLLGVAVHAWVLMGNHVHLLLTPRDDDGISRLMQRVASRYAHHFNQRYERTGTVWEGRHKSNPVQSSRYLLRCQRYIEMNPVKAGMVDHPEDYAWSSYRQNAHSCEPSWLTPHAEWLALGSDPEQRMQTYRALFCGPLESAESRRIRRHLASGQPWGDRHFKERLEVRHGASFGRVARGRPKLKRCRSE